MKIKTFFSAISEIRIRNIIDKVKMPGIFDKKNDVSLKKKNSLLIGSITGFLYLLFAIFLFFQINHLVTNEEAIAKLTLT